MYRFSRIAGLCLLSASFLCFCSCANVSGYGKLSYATEAANPLSGYALTGDTLPVLDPSIIRQGSTWYAFSTDVAGFPESGSLPIHCSHDKLNWTLCGSVFPEGIPSWIRRQVPGVAGLWAPDISYFNGKYHLYYNASVLLSQRTIIALATNTTLDPKDPDYKWVDQGVVLASKDGDDFNALDPNILVDSDGSVWMTYGSYWTGIKQRRIDPATGKLIS
jgi:arabinan endo-1,5-alpha-L-arabinosidase